MRTTAKTQLDNWTTGQLDNWTPPVAAGKKALNQFRCQLAQSSNGGIYIYRYRKKGNTKYQKKDTRPDGWHASVATA